MKKYHFRDNVFITRITSFSYYSFAFSYILYSIFYLYTFFHFVLKIDENFIYFFFAIKNNILYKQKEIKN